METISYSEARAQFRKTMEKVCDDCAPVMITRQNERPVVMMSLEDYQAMEETLYLLRSPENARRLLGAVSDVETGTYQKTYFSLDDDET